MKDFKFVNATGLETRIFTANIRAEQMPMKKMKYLRETWRSLPII